MAGPKKSEEEWFAKFEIQMIRDAKRKREQAEESEATGESKPDNYMLCPRDGAQLETEMIGDIEVDVCRECKGLWLDRGELEEIFLAKEEEKRGFFRKLLLG